LGFVTLAAMLLNILEELPVTVTAHVEVANTAAQRESCEKEENWDLMGGWRVGRREGD
jgi:hypothetical protein